MYPAFEPLFRNPHIATIAGNFWPRKIDLSVFPHSPVHYQVDRDNAVLALEHQPVGSAQGQIVCLHGLEGSADAGYIQSLTAAAIRCGFGVHRLNLRTCGGTESLCQTMYHSGLTQDTWLVLRQIRERFQQPVFLVGFSLGGNVALKLAGEYDCADVLSGLCSVSAPIDLAKCVRAIDKQENFLYARRFLNRLKGRIRRKSIESPHVYQSEHLDTVRSIWDFDDHYTAPLFGFGTAANYYQTQSAKNFLASIPVPALLIIAKDDPLVPFEIYESNADIKRNPLLQLLSPQFGGHLGFLSRRRPRFWLDGIILNWMEAVTANSSFQGTADTTFSSQ